MTASVSNVLGLIISVVLAISALLVILRPDGAVTFLSQAPTARLSGALGRLFTRSSVRFSAAAVLVGALGLMALWVADLFGAFRR